MYICTDYFQLKINVISEFSSIKNRKNESEVLRDSGSESLETLKEDEQNLYRGNK